MCVILSNFRFSTAANLDKKKEILAEAYRQFLVKGIADTRIDDIAKEIKISKKTIYSCFRSKEDLFIEMVFTVVNDLECKVQEVIEQDAPIIEKLTNYVEVLYTATDQLTLKTVGDSVATREKAKERMQKYLKEAVFSRMEKLLDQAKVENRLKENANRDSILMMYWEAVSFFVFTRPLKDLPQEFQEKPINELLANQLVSMYRGFLNETGINELDQQLKVHPVLCEVFS